MREEPRDVNEAVSKEAEARTHEAEARGSIQQSA